MNLLILNDYGITGGGAENRIKLLSEELLQQKIFDQIHLLELSDGRSEHKKIQIHRTHHTQIVSKVKELIRKYDISIVQAHNLAGLGSEAIPEAKKENVKVIFSAHDYWGFCGRRNLCPPQGGICTEAYFLKCLSCIGLFSSIHMQKVRRHLNYSDYAIAPSNFVIKLYEKHGILNNKWTKILPWVDKTTYTNNNSKREKTILFAGSLSYYKGAHILAEALPKVLGKFPETIIHFFGNSTAEQRKNIESICKKNGTYASVIFHPFCSQVELAKQYQKAGITVFCSLWPEPSSLSLQEAMSCGSPIVITRVGGLPEFANDTLLMAHPTPESVAQKILHYLQNPSLAKYHGAHNSQYAEIFTVKRAVQDLLPFYRQRHKSVYR